MTWNYDIPGWRKIITCWDDVKWYNMAGWHKIITCQKRFKIVLWYDVLIWILYTFSDYSDKFYFAINCVWTEFFVDIDISVPLFDFVNIDIFYMNCLRCLMIGKGCCCISASALIKVCLREAVSECLSLAELKNEFHIVTF